MTREGMGLIYSDGYNKAETLGESGGAFPRHANTQYLGQFGDPRIPNILKIHNNFARGLQQGRWADTIISPSNAAITVIQTDRPAVETHQMRSPW